MELLLGLLFLVSLPLIFLALGAGCIFIALITKDIFYKIILWPLGLLLMYPIFSPIFSEIYIDGLCKDHQMEITYLPIKEWKVKYSSELLSIFPADDKRRKVAYPDGIYTREKINSHFSKDKLYIERRFGIGEIRLKLIDTHANRILTETIYFQPRIKMGDTPDLSWGFHWPFRGNHCKSIKFYKESEEARHLGYDSSRLREKKITFSPYTQ